MTHVPWPDGLPDLPGVQAWISSSLPGDPEVHGPVQVYASYTTSPDIRVTARFHVASLPRPEATNDVEYDVIFRANLFPVHAQAAALYALVARLCPEDVPPVLAWEERDGGWFMLCRPFEGEIIEGLKSAEALQETARTLARIQAASADARVGETRLPCITVHHLPPMFDAVLSGIRDQHASVWEADTGPLSQALGFPAASVLHRLKPMRERVNAWASELLQVPWPLTIDHGDLHAGNAVRLGDGRVLIYDWENAALGSPFFSLDKLLVSAWNLDSGTSGPWGFVAGTPSQSAVRDAYIDTLPWRKRENRQRALDIALCLATVKEMHTEIAWAKAVGWKDDNPEWTAQLIRRLLQYADQT